MRAGSTVPLRKPPIKAALLQKALSSSGCVRAGVSARQHEAEHQVHLLLYSDKTVADKKTSACIFYVSACLQFIIMLPQPASKKPLQMIQNAAAHVLIRTQGHVSPILASLHWLPLKSRIYNPSPTLRSP